MIFIKLNRCSFDSIRDLHFTFKAFVIASYIAAMQEHLENWKCV